MRDLTGIVFALMIALPVTPVLAQQCPTPDSGRRGFVVERGDKQKSEVFHSDKGIVRTVMRYDGQSLLETSSFEGLFQLERVDSGQRTVIQPRDNLAALLPLRSGKTITAAFDYTADSGRSVPGTVVLVVKNEEPLFIGPCRYMVLKIEHSESRGNNPPRPISTDYYSPELKLVLMREYTHSDGQHRFVKYDRIYPIKD